jgi:biotin transport system substrate-specific component
METADTGYRVMIEAVWLQSGVGREIALMLGGSLLIALAAQFRVVLPFSPVPITGQTFAVLLLGALYGRTRGPATVMTYLALDGLGLPVFAGGSFGIATLVGPTAGYLLGVCRGGVRGRLPERARLGPQVLIDGGEHAHR